MDFAHATWGYLYHTAYDALDTIPLESLQHTGDNVLSLVRGLANAPELSDIDNYEGTKAVFFDFLNWFLIYYPDWAGIVINSLMAALGLGLIFGSFAIMAKDSDVSYGRVVGQFFINLGVQLLSIALGAGFSILMAVILNAAGGAMSWFTESWLIFGLYMCPFLMCTVLGPLLLIRFYKIVSTRENLRHSLITNPVLFQDNILLQTRINLFTLAQQMIFIVILIVMTAMTIRSAYIFVIVVIFFNATTIVNMIVRFRSFHWIYIHLIGQLFPLAYYSSFSLTTFSTFIPMQNRGNPESNPEFLIALFAIIVILMMSSFLTPMVAMMRKPFIYFGVVAIFWIITIIVSVTSVGFPYRAETSPQRYYVFVSRIPFSPDLSNSSISLLTAYRTELPPSQRNYASLGHPLLHPPAGRPHTWLHHGHCSGDATCHPAGRRMRTGVVLWHPILPKLFPRTAKFGLVATG